MSFFTQFSFEHVTENTALCNTAKSLWKVIIFETHWVQVVGGHAAGWVEGTRMVGETGSLHTAAHSCPAPAPFPGS